MSLSKPQQFIKDYINKAGESELIDRYRLPAYCHYTSGDGIFRNDSDLGRKYKFCRFSEKFNPNIKTSKAWDLTDKDRSMLIEEHSKLSFPKKGTQVYYIKFYGLGVKRRRAAIRANIKKEICRLPCVNCGTHTSIECDHKNDLVLEQNDEQVLNTTTQTLNDFQPLCKHCNDVKRGVKAKMIQEYKRQSAPGFPPHLAFTEGDETLDMTNLYWYKGTYWGDVLAFKAKLNQKIT
jgi:5-methylcytosine-specific restriction endonuclease McrA